MNCYNSIPSHNPAFSGFYFDSLNLIEHPYPVEQPSIYQGRSVIRLDNPFPVYHSQSAILPNNEDFLRLLTEHNIDSQLIHDPANFLRTDIYEIPQSVLDEYVPWHPAYEHANNPPSSITETCRTHQACLSGSVPEIREPTTISYWNPDHQLFNSQDFQPIAVVNTPNLIQTTIAPSQTEEMTEGNASIIEHQRSRYQSDPAYAARQRQGQRNRYKMLCKDHAFRERERERIRQLRRDPEYAERERVRRRERYNNDKVYAARERARQRAQYKNDHNFAERRLKKQQEYRNKRYHDDPDYAEYIRERQRNYQRTRKEKAKKKATPG